ncbi:MAG: 50S ribosomal protein L11 methyltransferase [Edaphocola sp.]
MNYLKIRFAPVNNSQKEILGAMLSVLPINGIEDEEDALNAYVEDRQVDFGYIDHIAGQTGINYITESVANRNWNEEWEKNFEPVTIDGFCSVRAQFHPKPDYVTYDIVITPKMSFGTGHHATTALMVQLMGDLNMKNKSVLDFGTGTGILAILAEKLGARNILAIDNDEWSYENAVENCAANHAQKVEVALATLADVKQDIVFDMILANINRHILLQYMDGMAQKIADGGRLLLSGILTEDIEIIKEAAQKAGLHFIQLAEKNNWVCMKFGK